MIKWRFSLVARLTTGEQCSPILSSLNKILLQQQNTALILPFSSCFAARAAAIIKPPTTKEDMVYVDRNHYCRCRGGAHCVLFSLLQKGPADTSHCRDRPRAVAAQGRLRARRVCAAHRAAGGPAEYALTQNRCKNAGNRCQNQGGRLPLAGQRRDRAGVQRELHCRG